MIMMAKSRARKIREKRVREGKRNPANDRGSYVFADMQTRKTKTKNEIMYQDKYGELPKVDRNETDGSSIFIQKEFSLSLQSANSFSKNAKKSTHSSMTLAVGFPMPCPAFCSRRSTTFESGLAFSSNVAANFFACAGTTRSSVSAVAISMGGYVCPSFTLWSGEYAYMNGKCSGLSGSPNSPIQK